MLKNVPGRQPFVAAVVGLVSSGCTGIWASYPTSSITPPEIRVTPVTPEFLEYTSRLKNSTRPAAPAAPQIDEGPAQGYNYVIGPGDILTLAVPSVVMANSSGPAVASSQSDQEGYLVYQDGTVYVPFVGNVEVGGLTLPKAQEKIVQSLSQFLRTPQVVVAVKEFRSQRVLVAGQVERPGYLPITDLPLTLVSALTATGGTAALRGRAEPKPAGAASGLELPDLRRVKLKRGNQSYEYDLEKMLASGDFSNDVVLRHEDVIVVPPMRRAHVVMLGEVKAPTMLEMVPNETDLSQVLMAAGGIDQLSSNPSRVYVIRGDFSRPDIYQIDLGAPDGMLLAQKFEIEPRDIVYVAEARITRWNRVLQQILPSIQGPLNAAIVTETLSEDE